MAHRAVLVGVWVAGTAVSVALGWGAVGLVRSNVDLTSTTDAADPLPDETSAPASTTSTSTRPVPTTSASSPRPTAVRTPARSASASPPPAAARRVTRTFELQGGTVQARCDGANVSLGYATPKGGFEVSVHEDGPVELSVRFRSDAHESRLDATCVDGTPSGRVREDPR